MNQQLGPNQTLWLEALRSGLYAQGTGYLNHTDKFCCLGVACEIFTDPLDLDTDLDGLVTIYEGRRSCAPEAIIDRLGLRGELGESFSNRSSLAQLNDDQISFHEIADLVTADPAVYFRSPR